MIFVSNLISRYNDLVLHNCLRPKLSKTYQCVAYVQNDSFIVLWSHPKHSCFKWLNQMSKNDEESQGKEMMWGMLVSFCYHRFHHRSKDNVWITCSLHDTSPYRRLLYIKISALFIYCYWYVISFMICIDILICPSIINTFILLTMSQVAE